MLPNPNDKYGMSNIAEAMKWVSVVTTVVGVMTVPPLGGIWLDYLLRTRCLFLIVGVNALGIRDRFLHVLRHCAKRCRTASSGPGRSRVLLAFIGCPPQNR